MLVYDQWDDTHAEVSPLLSSKEPTRRAEPKRIEMLGWETNRANSPGEQEDRWTEAEIGQQPMGEKRSPAARQRTTKTSCLSRTYAGNQPKGCLPTCPRQACIPHSPEESYIKDESLPNMILFSFVTVVLLKILVPKINWVVFNKINSDRCLTAVFHFISYKG